MKWMNREVGCSCHPLQTLALSDFVVFKTIHTKPERDLITRQEK